MESDQILYITNTLPKNLHTFHALPLRQKLVKVNPMKIHCPNHHPFVANIDLNELKPYMLNNLPAKILWS